MGDRLEPSHLSEEGGIHLSLQVLMLECVWSPVVFICSYLYLIDHDCEANYTLDGYIFHSVLVEL